MNKKEKDDYSAIREIYEQEYLEAERKRTKRFLEALERVEKKKKRKSEVV